MVSLKFSIHKTESQTSAEELADILAHPGFGKRFTDHMVTIDWNAEQGWHDAKVVPYAPLVLDPAASVLHYGQAIFEGIKAYRHSDGTIKTFRPKANAVRFQRSAARMAMPELPTEIFVESLRQLVDIDRDWVPAAGGEEALYLRPFMIATEATLGVHPSNSYRYVLIASPPALISQAVLSLYRCGYLRIMFVLVLEARVLQSLLVIMRHLWLLKPRRQKKVAIKWCGWMPTSIVISKRWEG